MPGEAPGLPEAGPKCLLAIGGANLPPEGALSYLSLPMDQNCRGPSTLHEGHVGNEGPPASYEKCFSSNKAATCSTSAYLQQVGLEVVLYQGCW